MRDQFLITWRGELDGWQGPRLYRPSPDYPGYIRDVTGDRKAIGEGTNPDDWQSSFDAWRDLKNRLQAMGWRDLSAITVRRIPRRALEAISQ